MINGRAFRPILYPKHLNSYAQCPERYYHERVERRRVEQVPSLALARGIAVHQVFAEIAGTYEAFIQTHGVPAVPSDLAAIVERALPMAPYPDPEAWASDIKTLVAEIKNGVAYLDGAARVLATEATYQYPHGGDIQCPPFVLAAKVDAILLRQTEDGRPYLDVVDWKGGASTRRDAIQELASRIVVKHNAKRCFEVVPAFIQNTTVHLRAGLHRSVVIDREEGRQRWSEIKRLAAGIVLAADWSPNPSPLCEWCPYFGNGCTLNVQTSQEDD
jgi:hypothetical protein